LNKILVILFLVFGFAGKAQELIQPFWLADSAKHRIDLRFEGYYNSRSLTNEFTSFFVNGGYIDTNLKNEISNDLSEENRIGAEVSYGINYRNYKSHLLGKPEWGWYTSLEDISNYYAVFSKNAFDLVFFGNSRFSGDTVQLADLRGEALHYQKFTFGGFHKNNNSSIGISLLKGQSYGGLNISNADLYTAPLGEELSLNLNGNYKQSDTLHNGRDAFNGWGISTDMVFYLNTGKNRNVKFQNAFRISIQNLGFIKWNEKSLETQLDSTYNFNGFEVNDLFDSSSYDFADRAKDSLKIDPVNKSFTTILPFTFSFAKIADPYSKDKLQGIYGARMRAFCQYKPLFFVGLFYKPVEKLNMNVYASVGGYGGFKLGYSLNFSIIKNMNLSLACTNLTGWGKQGYGKDATINLSYAF
jgi:hypothetical protein